jgi:hypothetical protein
VRGGGGGCGMAWVGGLCGVACEAGAGINRVGRACVGWWKLWRGVELVGLCGVACGVDVGNKR